MFCLVLMLLSLPHLAVVVVILVNRLMIHVWPPWWHSIHLTVISTAINKSSFREKIHFSISDCLSQMLATISHHSVSKINRRSSSNVSFLLKLSLALVAGVTMKTTSKRLVSVPCVMLLTWCNTISNDPFCKLLPLISLSLLFYLTIFAFFMITFAVSSAALNIFNGSLSLSITLSVDFAVVVVIARLIESVLRLQMSFSIKCLCHCERVHVVYVNDIVQMCYRINGVHVTECCFPFAQTI